MPEGMPGDKKRRDSKEIDVRGSSIWGNQYNENWIPEVQGVVEYSQHNEMWPPEYKFLLCCFLL